MSKQKIYMALVSLCGLSVFGISVHQTASLFMDYATGWDLIIYCAVMLVILVTCHMLPIYITSDKTMEISFVPVVACIVTKGIYLALILYVISSLFVFLKDAKTKKYYSPWTKSPQKELFNVSNVLISIWIGGLVYHLIVPELGGSVFTWNVVFGA
ncbi:MAG TPA: hypothetical protein DCY10_05410, partial [Clostridiales bacterium]|nr:hypothetical protein [Clostridiales bacterium]